MLKGETIIELTDVRTGEVEVHKDSNMFTNAIADVINTPSTFCQFDRFVNITDSLFPILDKLLGGVVLFPEALEEDATKYFAPYSVDATGFAGNVVNASTETRRGSKNLNESEPVLNDDGETIGYKYVWDFGTSQANGAIACVCLTHPTAGYNWYGCEDGNGRLVRIATINNKVNGNYPNSGSTQLSGDRVALAASKFYYSEKGNLYSIIGGKDIYISSFVDGKTAVGLSNVHFRAFENAAYGKKVFTIEGSEYVSASGSKQLMKLSEGFAIGLCHSNNSSGSATVKWIKINMSSGAYTEGTWTINAQVHDAYGRCVCYAGYLFWMASNVKGIYKINIDNPTDVTLISAPEGKTLSTSGIMNILPNGVIIGSNYYMAADAIHMCSNGGNGTTDTYRPGISNGLFCIGGSYNNSWGGSSYCNFIDYYFTFITPYLATINNLQSPVVKTADKTMKITYTITETE